MINGSKYDDNKASLLYQKEIDDINSLIKKVQDNYEKICHYLQEKTDIYEFKKPIVKKKAVDKLIDYNLIIYLISINDSLLKLYNENFRDKEKIDVFFIHAFYKKIIKYLYDGLNIIKMSHAYKNKKEINPLVNIYLEEKKNCSIQDDFFNSLYSFLKLIKNDSIRNICTNMIEDFNKMREEIIICDQEISDNYRRLDLFMHKERKEICDLEELRWFNEFLKKCCENIENKDKQKGLNKK